MKTSIFFLGTALAISAIVGGCMPIIQSGLPEPRLTERDKRMMALQSLTSGAFHRSETSLNIARAKGPARSLSIPVRAIFITS
jgi:hypothetical protein